MKKFNTWLMEAGGQKAGEVELLDMTLPDARDLALDRLGEDKLKDIPNFNRNFELAQQLTQTGWMKRKDMPVIDSVESFKNAIDLGFIDLQTGKMSEQSGLQNRINVVTRSIKAKDILPSQKQIYLDKALKSLDGNVESAKYFLQTTKFVSSFGTLLDGHHRWLTAVLVDPEMMLQVVTIEMPINDLLPLAVAYSDSVGNKRNK